jgi:hypothetical protein
MGVGSSYTCASTITWTASHYYRHLFGLAPVKDTRREAINVLWLSRAKLDRYAFSHNDWSNWRDIRHIDNEPELIHYLSRGLESLCEHGDCVYQDARDEPESWSHVDLDDDEPMKIRFAFIDPTVHALETQIHFVGHTTILVSSHGGALGLSLFLPPGRASILELQVQEVTGNYHFQHMAYEMGHGYELIGIEKTVNVIHLWERVKSWVENFQA